MAMLGPVPSAATRCASSKDARPVVSADRETTTQLETAIGARGWQGPTASARPAATEGSRDALVVLKPWKGGDQHRTRAIDPESDAGDSSDSDTSDSDHDHEAVVIAIEETDPWLETEIPIVVKPLAGSVRSNATEATALLSKDKSSPLSTTSIDSSFVDDTPDVKAEFRRLCELSWPVIFTYVLEEFPEMIGLTLVGHMDSPMTNLYVDAAALSTMFVNLTAVALGFGLATALDTLCSQAYGAGKPMKMGIYFQTGIIVLGVAFIPIFVINWYTEPFLLWLHQPAEVAALAARFTRWVLPGIPFMYLYELLKKILEAQNVVAPMVNVAIVSNIINLVLGVYLTWYTPLGFDGAAIARTVSYVALPLALVPYMHSNSNLDPWWPGWQLRRAAAKLPEFLALGVPGMLMVLLEWWAFEVMQIAVGWLPNGIMAISVQSVLANISTTTFNFFFGISVATSICVGNYVGSDQPRHAKLVSLLGMALSLGVSLVLTVLILITRPALPGMFLNDPTAIAMSAHALLFLLPYQQLDALNGVMQGVFRGTGRMQLATYINFFGWIAIGLPAGGILGFTCGLGVEGMWLGLTLGAAVAVVLSAYKIWRTDWEEMADDARLRAS